MLETNPSFNIQTLPKIGLYIQNWLYVKSFKTQSLQMCKCSASRAIWIKLS